MNTDVKNGPYLNDSFCFLHFIMVMGILRSIFIRIGFVSGSIGGMGWDVRFVELVMVKIDINNTFDQRCELNVKFHLQGVLALCEFHYCEFCYCGFLKLLL